MSYVYVDTIVKLTVANLTCDSNVWCACHDTQTTSSHSELSRRHPGVKMRWIRLRVLYTQRGHDGRTKPTIYIYIYNDIFCQICRKRENLMWHNRLVTILITTDCIILIFNYGVRSISPTRMSLENVVITHCYCLNWRREVYHYD